MRRRDPVTPPLGFGAGRGVLISCTVGVFGRSCPDAARLEGFLIQSIPIR